ncbi:hypothetical protein [Pseudobacteriovorax antillogorgiicola]|uniref:Uncharacterized protein n=1 Tax=Pseudobacteriovorax antillogorgiicola TaxID=1513793 RepID=A0A1Y6CDG4_9BACT|nr:hypothetical protein [Pseudobacteriovorax antillogorgiicola]TCS48256.1 hypothetical protein EDD56_11836 [Pseudobacteriovorax antillogorgiicola]SMF57196.1 hypothetical protein SAMN06296036_118105 [Pseudobacteriovorax antillogorgiicola]
MKSPLPLSILMTLNLACTTIAYDIETEVTFADSFRINDPRVTSKHVTVEQTINYELSIFHPTACFITAFAYGGWCWSYLFLKSVYSDYAIEESDRRLKKKLGNPSANTYSINSTRLLDTHLKRAIETYQISSWGDHLEQGEPFAFPKSATQPPTELEIEPHITDKAVVAAKLNGMFIGVDGGTSHSSHGIGVSGGYGWHNYALQIGYGFQSKRNLIGNPISLSALIFPAIHHQDANSYFKLGATYYGGQGKRHVIFGDNLPIELDAKWSFIYTRLGVGVLNRYSYFQVYYEGGISTVAHARIVPNHSGVQSNLDDGQGIRIEDSDTFGFNSNAGYGDVGAYFQMGVLL